MSPYMQGRLDAVNGRPGQALKFKKEKRESYVRGFQKGREIIAKQEQDAEISLQRMNFFATFNPGNL